MDELLWGRSKNHGTRVRATRRSRRGREEEEKKRERGRQREKSAAALWSSWQWLTGCVFALGLQPWKLVESRRRRCCLLSIPVRCPSVRRSPADRTASRTSRDREKGMRFPRVRESPASPEGMSEKKRPIFLPLSLSLPGDTSFTATSSSSILTRDIFLGSRSKRSGRYRARLAGVLPERWPPPLTEEPIEAPTSFPSPVPHQYPTDEFAMAWTRRVREITRAHPAWILRAFLRWRFSFLPLSHAFLLCFMYCEMYSNYWWVFPKTEGII